MESDRQSQETMSELPAGRQLDVRIHKQFFGTEVQRREQGGKADYFSYEHVVVRSIPVADDPFDVSAEWVRVPEYSTNADGAYLLDERIRTMGGSVCPEYIESREGAQLWRVTVALLGKKPVTREAPGETYALALCHAALAALES